jgi:hypothetical protein
MSVTRILERSNSRESSELLTLLTEQCALYQRLTGLSEQQGVLIAGNQPEQLLEVLGQRQQVIDRLGRLAERMRPYQRDWPAVRARLSEADGARVDEMLARANACLASILEKDKADAELLARRKGETAVQMTQLKSTRAAGAAYAASQQFSSGPRAEWTGA